jgi:hypothetical protein
MELWLQEYLESERDSMFQNNTLNLANRKIQKIDWIPENKYSINLCYNNLEYLPDLHPYIEYLSLADNSFQKLPLLPRRLMYLNVDKNPLLELPDLPRTLKALRASFCSLLTLPSLPRHIECVYVGYNHLKELPALPEGIDTLDVEENNLQELPYLPDSLRILNISRNPGLRRFYGKSLQEIRQLVKCEIAKKRCLAIKEELVMAAWHPRRVEAWLNLGYDPDD